MSEPMKLGLISAVIALWGCALAFSLFVLPGLDLSWWVAGPVAVGTVVVGAFIGGWPIGKEVRRA